jgi:cerevisin
MRAVLSLSLLPLLAAASPVLNVGTINQDSAPILSSTNAQEIPDSYIVVFKKHVTTEAAVRHHDWVRDMHTSSEDRRTELRKRSQFPFQDTVYQGLKHTYDIAGDFLGYSGHFDENVIEQVRNNPDVNCVPTFASTS